jgi:hypothetical protein
MTSDPMTDDHYMLETIMAELVMMRGLRVYCSECMKKEAGTICDACNKPCCFLCVRSTILQFSCRSTDGYLHVVPVKRCVSCLNDARLPSTGWRELDELKQQPSKGCS